MSDLPPEIMEHYTAEIDEDLRIRNGLNELELVRTQHILRRYLATPPVRIADVGGATGVHAEWLLADGHEVVLIEPVPSQVEQAIARLGDSPRFSAHVGNALELPLATESCDVVLLMGPLYHLVERGDRLQALHEALRVVRPGGVVAAAAISRFASLLDGLQQGYVFDPEFRALVTEALATGRHENAMRRPGWFTTAHFHHPETLAQEGLDAGLDAPEVLGVEGPAALFASLAPRWEDDAGREIMLWAAAAVEEEPALLGASPHLLLVGRKSPH